MGVIQRMGMVATDKNDKPQNPIQIHRATPYREVPPEHDDKDALEDGEQQVLAIEAS